MLLVDVRISSGQNRLMDKMGEQGRRIGKLSKIEHDLIKDVPPQVGEIKQDIAEMLAAVMENPEEAIGAGKENAEGFSPAADGNKR